MKKLVEEGQAKVSTPSKITKGVGDVAQFILSAKGMIDLAIQNIPQAALPWAGVCVGLQVSNHPHFNCLVSVSTDIHPDPLESCESDKIQPCWHRSCCFQNGLVLRPNRTSPEKDNIVIGNESFESVLQLVGKDGCRALQGSPPVSDEERLLLLPEPRSGLSPRPRESR